MNSYSVKPAEMYKKEIADLTAELARVKEKSKVARQEFETELARLRDSLARREREQAELKKDLDKERDILARRESEQAELKKDLEEERDSLARQEREKAELKKDLDKERDLLRREREQAELKKDLEEERDLRKWLKKNAEELRERGKDKERGRPTSLDLSESSLLIKPGEHLLKYPLLLSTIVEETPDVHPDENLRNARIKFEEVARNVNEEWRRAEVVKDVLMSKKDGKLNPGVGVAAQVNLSKAKTLRHGGMRSIALAEAAESNGTGGDEAILVEQMHTELKRIDDFVQQFAKDVVYWSKMMSRVMVALRAWAIDFGKVIGLAPEQGFGSEAFDAFLDLVEKQLMPLGVELEGTINERLLKDMAHLLTTMNKPLKLLASMNEQEPYHYHLLTMPVSAKNRLPPSLLAASTNYLALRSQLAAELPTYLRLLHRGFDGFVIRLAEIQTEFWGHVRERWGDLWKMVRVEGELNAGREETVDVWMTRWSDVDEIMKSIGILKPGRVEAQVNKIFRRIGNRDHGVTSAALYQQQYPGQQQQRRQQQRQQ